MLVSIAEGSSLNVVLGIEMVILSSCHGCGCGCGCAFADDCCSGDSCSTSMGKLNSDCSGMAWIEDVL